MTRSRMCSTQLYPAWHSNNVMAYFLLIERSAAFDILFD